MLSPRKHTCTRPRPGSCACRQSARSVGIADRADSLELKPGRFLTADKRVNAAAEEVDEVGAETGQFASARAVTRANYSVDSRGLRVELTIGSIPEPGGSDD